MYKFFKKYMETQTNHVRKWVKQFIDLKVKKKESIWKTQTEDYLKMKNLET